MHMPSMPAGMPGMPDPNAIVAEVSQQLQDAMDKSGLGDCANFVDKLENLKEQAKAGPGAILDALKEKITEFKDKIQEALDNPGSLAPSSLAGCASYIGGEVVKKLKAFMKLVQDLFDKIKDGAADIIGKMKPIGETMTNAMVSIKDTVTGMIQLPADVKAIKGDDLKSVDTGGMKAKLDSSKISAPLDKLGGLKAMSGDAAQLLGKLLATLQDFLEGAADKIKDAFSVPQPFCFLNSCAKDSMPPIMNTLLDQVQNIKKIDLSPAKDMASDMADKLGNLDVSKVKDPVASFSKMAGDPIDKLDKAVQMAKKLG